MSLNKTWTVPQQKTGSFLKTLVGTPVILEFQESDGNHLTVEIPEILERRYAAGHDGYYLRNTGIQILAREIEGFFYLRRNERTSTGIVLSAKFQHMLKCENGMLSI